MSTPPGPPAQPYPGQPAHPYPGQPAQPYAPQPGRPYPPHPGQPYAGQPYAAQGGQPYAAQPPIVINNAVSATAFAGGAFRRRRQSMGVHVVLFCFTAGIGNVLYAMYISRWNKDRGL
ncbi:hypothetical protein [Streptomyces sp. NPDC005573]|uniref:hypothetical protein n=1 Tax=Streptomyces sp. NPDC005573 TaxID=3156890 RepID=UPI0033A8FF20